MSKLRRVAGMAGAALLTTIGVAVLTQAPAAAAPNHQVPFRCGVTVTASTWTGHNPLYSVDFQRSGITGMPVLASAGGTVSVVGNTGNTSYGRWVEINHGSGYRTRYAHLNSQSVSVGQSVGQGTQIGTAGATGGVTGPHLHYEQRTNGTVVKAVLNGVAVPYFTKTSFTSRNNCGGNPYTPEQVCGSGFSVIDSAALSTAGRTYLLYNASTKYNCTATMKSTSVGTPSPVSAFLQVQGGTKTTDSGNFSYYAGPVKKYAPAKCVSWGGSVGSASYASPFEHCG